MADITYQLQEGRYGEDWQDVRQFPRDQSDLAAWIALAENMDSFEGKYEHRIIDNQGVVVWQVKSPYEPIRINIYGNPYEWMERLRKTYGIDAELWAKACQAFLEKVKTNG